MTLFVSKLERRDAADRDALGKAVLNSCRAARANDGVRSARFYWVNPDEIAVIVDAEQGAWGPGSGVQATPEQAVAAFAVADLAQQTSLETWVEAGQGEQTYRLAQEAAAREPAIASR